MIDRLYHDAALARFYDLDNGWGEDLTFCAKLAEKAGSVLDLGCGTGRFAASLAGKHVVGIDPAGAMLEIAQLRPGGEQVTWVQADARSLRLGQTFDLVVMTGHAFQTMLADCDQLALCRTIAAHLAPEGVFLFDSREPACAEWLEWTPQRSQRDFADPEFGQVRAFNDAHHDLATGIVTYGTYYKAGGGKFWQAQSQIRFTSQSEIEQQVAEAGLKVDRWLGDWQGGPLGPGQPEIIAVGSLSR